jgi:FMN phosphatase YigB (HAD superfamily)
MKDVSSKEIFLFDLDGTLLDQRFDNIFWNQTVPRVLAHEQGLTLSDCKNKVYAHYEKVVGTLDWYSSDFWGNTFNIDIIKLTHQEREKITIYEGAEALLSYLSGLDKKLFLVTNAHPDILNIKLNETHLDNYFDGIYSSHTIGHAKEDLLFWDHFFSQTQLSVDDAVLVDDNISVLMQARIFGVSKCIAITQPDSSQMPIQVNDFTSFQSVAELLKCLTK